MIELAKRLTLILQITKQATLIICCYFIRKLSTLKIIVIITIIGDVKIIIANKKVECELASIRRLSIQGGCQFKSMKYTDIVHICIFQR